MYRTRSFGTTDIVEFYFNTILWIILSRNENQYFKNIDTVKLCCATIQGN